MASLERKRHMEAPTCFANSSSDDFKRPRVALSLSTAVSSTFFQERCLDTAPFRAYSMSNLSSTLTEQSQCSSEQETCNGDDDGHNCENGDDSKSNNAVRGRDNLPLRISVQEVECVENNVDSLTSTMDCWSLTNLKEWRRQQLPSHSEHGKRRGASGIRQRQKEAIREIMAFGKPR